MPAGHSHRAGRRSATIGFAALDVPDIGDSSEAVSANLALTAPNGTT